MEISRWRWVVERTFAWLNQFRRLCVCYEKRADIHEGILVLGLCSDLLALPASRLGGFARNAMTWYSLAT